MNDKIIKDLIKKIYRKQYEINPSTKERIISTADLEMLKIAKRSYARAYSREDIEDALMDAVMGVWEKVIVNPEYAAKVTMSTITFKMRKLLYRRRQVKNGLTQNGKVPKGGRYATEVVTLDRHGENIIEQIGYDEDGSVILPGTSGSNFSYE